MKTASQICMRIDIAAQVETRIAPAQLPQQAHLHAMIGSSSVAPGRRQLVRLEFAASHQVEHAPDLPERAERHCGEDERQEHRAHHGEDRDLGVLPQRGVARKWDR
jgi:hypothetical protein